MAIRVVRLGSPREPGEGLRIGTVRRPPRGVKKSDYGRLDFYDVWLPQLAPGAELIKRLKSGADFASSWRRFEADYVRGLSTPDCARLLDLLASFSKETDFSFGCYCEDESKCHRSILRRVLATRGAIFR